MHSWIELDSKGIQHNFGILNQHIGSSSICPVLKGNAYGHGLAPFYSVLKELKPNYIGCFTLEEARKLRKLGFKEHILNMGPLSTIAEMEEAGELNLDQFITSKEALELWKLAKKKSRPHIKIETGLHRQGIFPSDLEKLAPNLLAQVVGICSHVAACEDMKSRTFTQNQLQTLLSCQKHFTHQPLLSLASSAPSLNAPETHLDICRIGISIYGIWPSKQARSFHHSLNPQKGAPVELKPVLSFKTRVSSTKKVKAGENIGYGLNYHAEKDSMLAIVPIGYAEGYPRAVSNSEKGHVLIKGSRCSIKGRICMNMMMVDVSHLSSDLVGEEVVLIGSQDNLNISSDMIAEWSSTISYEVVTQLNSAIPRKIR